MTRTASIQSRTSPPHGFTLIELILGIGVMAIVLVAMNAVFFSTMRLRERTSVAVEESLPVQQTLSTLRRDLQGAMPPMGMLAGDFKVGSVSGFGGGAPVEIEFCTSTGILRESEPWGDVQRISYGLRVSGAQGEGSDLYRYVTRNLLAAIAPQPEEHWMMGGVDFVELSCYDGIQWREYWDTSVSDTNLPSAVRIRIHLAGRQGGSQAEPVEMVVPIASQTRTNVIYLGEQ